MQKNSSMRSRFRLLPWTTRHWHPNGARRLAPRLVPKARGAHLVHTLLLGCIVGGSVLVYPSVTRAQTDRERDGLRGPVHQVVSEKIRATFPPPAAQDTFESESDPLRPQLIPSLPAHPGLSPDWQQGPRLPWRTMVYDFQGKRTEAIFYTDGGTRRWLWRYTNDSQGHRLTRTSYAADGSVRWARRYFYASRGRVTSQTEHDAAGKLARRWYYTYDAAGHVIEERNVDANGALVWQWRYAYDASGRRIEKTQYTIHDTRVQTWFYTYDSAGNLLEKAAYSANNALRWKRRYIYNPQGGILEEHHYRTDGSLQGKWRYTYVYDARGNWVKRTTATWVTIGRLAFFEPSEITFRRFMYY